jgi:hypothetical protein
MTAAAVTPIHTKPTAGRSPWGIFLFLWGIFYLAAPLDVKFTTTEIANVMTNDLST